MHISEEPAFLVVIGGMDKPTSVNIYKLYDGQVSWLSNGTSPPVGWEWAGVTVHGTVMYIIGGRNTENSSFTLSLRYNLQDHSWEALPKLSLPRANQPPTFIINEKVYTVGGRSTAVSIDNMETLDLNNMESGWKKEGTNFPHKTHMTASVVTDQRAYICAGKERYDTSVISWAPGDAEWKAEASLMYPRKYHCTVAHGPGLGHGFIWVLGGCETSSCWNHGFVERYSTQTQTWTRIASAPDIAQNSNYTAACGIHGRYIYAVFSSRYRNELYGNDNFVVFDMVSNTWETSSTKMKDLSYQAMSAVVSF